MGASPLPAPETVFELNQQTMPETPQQTRREMEPQPLEGDALTLGTLEIQPAVVLDEALRSFLQAARLAMFPDRIDPQVTPPDINEFAATYVAGVAGLGAMLVARHAEAGIVGTVAYRAYDHRFPQLDYRGQCVVEVVRLFVRPAFRRSGLASRLFQMLRAHAERAGVAVMYLHTHPFLPGALEFWRGKGFRTLVEEEEPVWQTIHMECELTPP